MQDKYTIEITTQKNPLKCHNLLTDVKKGKTELTPEFALDFLRSTNNHKNITVYFEVLESHLQNHPETAKDYRYALLGVIANRNQPETIIQKVAALRQAYHISGMEKYVKDNALKGKDKDFSYIRKLVFGKRFSELNIERYNLSETELDFSQAESIDIVRFAECKMPPTLNLSSSNIWSLYLDNLDLADLALQYPKTINWMDICGENTKFPPVLDLSEIENVKSLTFTQCDMHQIQEIKFPQSMDRLYLRHVQLPEGMDITKLQKNCWIITDTDSFLTQEKQTIEENNNRSSLKSRLSKWLKGKLDNAR